jgi:hypothetical protein
MLEDRQGDAALEGMLEDSQSLIKTFLGNLYLKVHDSP